jgi:cobyrinic acid a,c-diamide synthase
LQATNSQTGQFEGFPRVNFYGFASVAALAAALDLKVILLIGVSGAARIARHL